VKKLLAILLALTMAASIAMPAHAARPENFPDLPQGWSHDFVVSAINDGLLMGDNGLIKPQDLLTRAQMAAILVRALGVTTKGVDLSEFVDVDNTAWYYRELSIAVGIGLLQGDAGSVEKTMRPNAYITRQEVAVVLQRAFFLGDASVDLTMFKDSADIAPWALSAICVLVRDIKMEGYEDGTLRPNQNITREEFVKLLYRLVAMIISEPGEYTIETDSIVLIRVPGVTIKDSIISGGIILGDDLIGSDVTIINSVYGSDSDSGSFIVRNKDTDITDPNTPLAEQPTQPPQPAQPIPPGGGDTVPSYTFRADGYASTSGANVSGPFDYAGSNSDLFYIDLGVVITEHIAAPYKALVNGYALAVVNGASGSAFKATASGSTVNVKDRNLKMSDVCNIGEIEMEYDEAPYYFYAKASVTGSHDNYTINVIRFEAKITQLMATGSASATASLYSSVFGSLTNLPETDYLSSVSYTQALEDWWRAPTTNRASYIRVLTGGVTAPMLANINLTVEQAHNSRFAISGEGLYITVIVN
jgi:hypothetical protein